MVEASFKDLVDTLESLLTLLIQEIFIELCIARNMCCGPGSRIDTRKEPCSVSSAVVCLSLLLLWVCTYAFPSFRAASADSGCLLSTAAGIVVLPPHLTMLSKAHDGDSSFLMYVVISFYLLDLGLLCTQGCLVIVHLNLLILNLRVTYKLIVWLFFLSHSVWVHKGHKLTC